MIYLVFQKETHQSYVDDSWNEGNFSSIEVTSKKLHKNDVNVLFIEITSRKTRSFHHNYVDESTSTRHCLIVCSSKLKNNVEYVDIWSLM